MTATSLRTAFAVAALAALAVISEAAHAQEGWAALAAPGTHAIMRHALAPGTGDPQDFRLGECSTQRNLSEAGREQAREIGRAIKANGILVTRVLTSQWCRATETARLLAAAPVIEETALNSFFSDRAEGAEQTARLRQLLAAAAQRDKWILVSHQVNITALTGLVPASGEVLVIRVGADGEIDVVERIPTEAP